METYTINQIQDEMTAAGSHWWDPSSMRFFQTRVSEKVYQGTGEVFFVTSEKPPGGNRAYSVRQYSVRQHSPVHKTLDTVGEFCAMSRNQAHREAAKLAGPAAVVVAEVHQPVSDAKQLAIDIERNGGRYTDTHKASYLIRLATRHHKIMEDYCNGVDIYDADGEPLPELASLRKKIETAAKECKCGVLFFGDPRGCTVKLIMPNDETNDFAAEGWCIPIK